MAYKNTYRKLKVICDADDVLMSCNEYALHLLSTATGNKYDLSEITDWGILGKEVDRRMDYFNTDFFYNTQPALNGARKFLISLMEKADVFIATAVAPEHMGERIAKIQELFPEFPVDHIIMGKRKDLLHGDIMLDDKIDNLLESNCNLPVLFRQPWNQSASGICCVDNYDDFLTLVDFMNGDKVAVSRIPKILCIVGPSGSRKQDLADYLCMNGNIFERISTCTTARPRKAGANRVSHDEFDRIHKAGEFIETTWYNHERFGIRKKEIDEALEKGKYPVIVMDISGCLSVYNTYPGQCEIIYADRNKRDCIMSIIQKPALRREQVADRIISFEFEEKNKVLADHIVKISSTGFMYDEIDDIRKYLGM